MRPRNGMRPIHPGEILREEFLAPLHMSANRLAIALRVPANRITEIINGNRGVTAETALRLARFLGTTPEFWLNLQQAYEIRSVEHEMGNQILREIEPIKRPA